MTLRTSDRKLEAILNWIISFSHQRDQLIKATGTRISDMPLPVLICFLYIACHNPCNAQDIAKATGMSPAAVSRNTDWLCAERGNGEAGMNLISKRKDPLNKRLKTLLLTQLGEEQIALLKSTLIK